MVTTKITPKPAGKKYALFFSGIFPDLSGLFWISDPSEFDPLMCRRSLVGPRTIVECFLYERIERTEQPPTSKPCILAAQLALWAMIQGP